MSTKDDDTPKPDHDGWVWSVDPNDDRNKPDDNGRYPRHIHITATKIISKEEHEAN